MESRICQKNSNKFQNSCRHVNFAQMLPKQVKKVNIFFSIQFIVKWPDHFLSGKQFQKEQIATLS
jgi:hypothetical protein